MQAYRTFAIYVFYSIPKQFGEKSEPSELSCFVLSHFCFLLFYFKLYLKLSISSTFFCSSHIFLFYLHWANTKVANYFHFIFFAAFFKRVCCTLTWKGPLRQIAFLCTLLLWCYTTIKESANFNLMKQNREETLFFILCEGSLCHLVYVLHTECLIDLGKLNLTIEVLILSLSQFLLLAQLPQKMKLASKVVKIDSK